MSHFFSHEESVQGVWGAGEDVGLRPEAGRHSVPNCQGLQRDRQWREFSLSQDLSRKLRFLSCICTFLIRAPCTFCVIHRQKVIPEIYIYGFFNFCIPFSLQQFRYKESHQKEKGQQVGLRCVEDDPKMVHSLAASKLQSNLEYKRQSKEDHGQYKMHADQPEFLQAKKSQAQASDLTYRHKLHDYTCDAEQLNVKHAKQAYKLQSDVGGSVDGQWT